MKNILEDLEILILQNEDDFDRGSGKFILRNFIKEKQAEQLTLTDVACSAEEAIILLKYYEEKCFKKVNGKLVLVRDEYLQKYNNYKNWLDNKELNYR